MNITTGFHLTWSVILQPERNNFAYYKQAKMSSLTNSGWSSMISCMVIPEPSMSISTSTGQRIWRMQGLPWQMAGSLVILSNKVIVIGVKVSLIYETETNTGQALNHLSPIPTKIRSPQQSKPEKQCIRTTKCRRYDHFILYKLLWTIYFLKFLVFFRSFPISKF